MRFVVNGFQPAAPRFASRLLKDQQAAFASNVKLTSGDARGFGETRRLHVFEGSAARVRRFIKNGVSYWWSSLNKEDDALRNPLANDAHDRVVVFSRDRSPRLSTLLEIEEGDAPTPLGIPTPIAGLTVSPTGGSAANEARAYLFTYVSAFGEESGPSPPAIATGHSDGTWTLTLPGSPPTDRRITRRWIYRSVSGDQTAGDWHLLADVPIADTTYVDTALGSEVVLGASLQSQSFIPPPAGLHTAVLHVSGSIAAAMGRDVWFSEPYLPHAWPIAYTVSFDWEVVGLAAFENAIAVMTKGSTYLLVGSHPSVMAKSLIAEGEPCLAKRSIVSAAGGAYYASPNGIMEVTLSGVDRATNTWMTEEQWLTFSPASITAALYNQNYLAFTSSSRGFLATLGATETAGIVVLDRFDGVDGVDYDAPSGDVFLLRGGSVDEWDAVPQRRFSWSWTSKEWITPRPVNLGALQVLFDDSYEATEEDAQLVEAMVAYDLERFDYGPLDGFALYPIGAGVAISPPLDAAADLPILQPIQPLGGSPLFDVDNFFSEPQVTITYIADGQVIWNQTVTDQRVKKLPSGNKYTRHQIILQSAWAVQTFVMAETGKECALA